MLLPISFSENEAQVSLPWGAQTRLCVGDSAAGELLTAARPAADRGEAGLREICFEEIPPQSISRQFGSDSEASEQYAILIVRERIVVQAASRPAMLYAAETLLHAHPEGKVIFLTAHETENMILMSMGAGATDYVVKGCSDEELMRHIRSAMAGEPMLDVRIQQTVLKEYNRLRRSEKSLLFFINNVAQLTPAERTLVRYLIDGKKVREIAELRCVEVVTVKTQIKSLLRKFGCARSKEIVELIEELNVGHLF